jgi:hypothetical protein
MDNRLLSPRNLIAFALSAVFSLAAGHLVDLGAQVLGPGPASTPAVVGDLAGLAACAGSAWLGVRGLRRLRCAPPC